MSASFSESLGAARSDSRPSSPDEQQKRAERAEARADERHDASPDGDARGVVRSVELRARVRGVGLWTPTYSNFDAWVDAGMPADLHLGPDAEGRRPPATLLHSRLRRRTSALTRAAVTALEAALGTGGAALDQVRFVLVSSFGEIETTVEILEMLGDPSGPISPTKFHNSVHNTATGYMSIASGNHREATALAGGPHNLEAGLLETLAGLAEDGGDAVLIFAEELLPAPFQRDDADPTFAVAVHLAGASADPGTVDAAGLDLELRLASRPAGAGAGPLGRGVGSSGLPSMVAPLVELLRGIVALRGADRSTASRAIELAPGRDPALAAEWIASLHPA